MRDFLLFVLLFVAPNAFADSFCSYEAGLIGTSGVGFVMPYSVETAEYNYQEKRCEVPVFAAPDTEKVSVINCAQIQELPSQYNKLVFEGDPIFASEYFAFLVFEWRGRFARVQLKTGEDVWIKTTHISAIDKFGPEDVIGWRGLRSSKHVYNAPDVEAIAPAENIEGPIAQSFVARAYEYAGVPFEIPEKRWDWFFETREPGDFYFDFAYHVIDVVEDPNGALWYVAEEHLAIAALVRQNHKQELIAILGDPFEGVYYSPVIRTVHLPYRDENGLVQSVFLRGPYCD